MLCEGWGVLGPGHVDVDDVVDVINEHEEEDDEDEEVKEADGSKDGRRREGESKAGPFFGDEAMNDEGFADASSSPIADRQLPSR